MSDPTPPVIIYHKFCAACRRPFTTPNPKDSQCYCCRHGGPST